MGRLGRLAIGRADGLVVRVAVHAKHLVGIDHAAPCSSRIPISPPDLTHATEDRNQSPVKPARYPKLVQVLMRRDGIITASGRRVHQVEARRSTRPSDAAARTFVRGRDEIVVGNGPSPIFPCRTNGYGANRPRDLRRPQQERWPEGGPSKGDAPWRTRKPMRVRPACSAAYRPARGRDNQRTSPSTALTRTPPAAGDLRSFLRHAPAPKPWSPLPLLPIAAMVAR